MKIKIGIPRAFLYYRYYVLWKNFFQFLGCNIVLSSPTNKEIVSLGINNSIDESCLSSKIYIGHVMSVMDKCDYLLVPRICDYGKTEKVCVRFNGLYDNIKNQFPNIKMLDYNIEYTKHKYEFFEFIKMGFCVNKNVFKIILSYIIAKKKEKEYNICLNKRQNSDLRNIKKKILIVSHPYNIYDKYIGEPITDYFKKKNITLIYADRLNKKIAKEYYNYYSPTLYWTYSKELVGAIYYYKNAVDGIIFLTSFPCGPDSLVNELIIRKENNLPILNLIVDEATSPIGLETRLESFLDVINQEENYYE